MAKIDPWGNVEVKDYSHLFQEFGLKPFSSGAGLDHYLFEREIIIAHRDFDKVLDRIKHKKPFVNMTGIASSGGIHFGHKVDVDLFRYFKKKGGRNYFAVCDLDGYVSRSDDKVSSLEKAKEFAVNNLSHALALGLDEEDCYVQSRKSPHPERYYSFCFELSKKITMNAFEAIYGHLDMGKIAANFLQYGDILHPQLPEFEGKMPSVTGIGLDQDPHARAVRDIAKRLPYNFEIPGFLYFKHQGGLKEGAKMSSSDPDTAIFLDDSPSVARKKIERAFSGGRPTAEEQRRLGGNPDICKVCEMLRFHYPDTKKFNKIIEDYRAGKILDKENKQFAADFVCDFLEEHQSKLDQTKKTAKKMVFGK
ncbi:MAG: tryptophan--tRNA ligase [Candidatus Diapherotrites archaeon]